MGFEGVAFMVIYVFGKEYIKVGDIDSGRGKGVLSMLIAKNVCGRPIT